MKIDIHFPSDGGVIAFCHELKRASFGYPSSTIEEWARNKPEKAMRHWKKELLCKPEVPNTMYADEFYQRMIKKVKS